MSSLLASKLSRPQRDEKIIVALRAHGYMARAAFEAGCDARTVRRLIESNPLAAAALAVGTTHRLQQRLNVRRAQEAEADADLRLQVARVKALREQLITEHVELGYSHMKTLEHDIADGIVLLKKKATILRRARRNTKDAVKRLEEIEGPSADA